jgi:DNA-binding transcriptional ArsR family regulator
MDDLLLATMPTGRFAPPFYFPSPRRGAPPTLDSELEQLAATPAASLAEDLHQAWEGELPARVRDLIAAGDAGPPVLAEAIQAYWDVAIAPHWPRMRAVLDEDVAFRATAALRGGLFALLADIHPEASLRGDGRVLAIDKPQHADHTYQGAVLTLVPSVFVWPRLLIGHSGPTAFKLTYAARGVGRVWEGPAPAEPELADGDRLGALIGRSRAAILACLDVPMSTTQLAKRLAQSPGSVSTHLGVLRDSGLVTSRRSGRSVMYQQTALGTSVVSINQPRRRRALACGPTPCTLGQTPRRRPTCVLWS